MNSHPTSVQRMLCAAFAAILFVAPLGADDTAEIRTQFGAKMFRALLNVDLDVEKKTVDKNQLLIVFVYNDDKSRAADVAQRFVGDTKEGGVIHGLAVITELSADSSLAAYKSRVPAGIFLAQPPPNGAALKTLIRYGIEHHVIVYSPFEGHVEQGVLGGLSIEAQVRPYVNLTTLAASGVNLKQLIFKVTKVTR